MKKELISTNMERRLAAERLRKVAHGGDSKSKEVAKTDPAPKPQSKAPRTALKAVPA